MSETSSNPLFTLEALQAGKGDCLILHFGAASQPKFVLIDGGPRLTFETSIQPRLDQLKRRWTPKGSLMLEMLIVSHIDDDHIRGVLDLTAFLGKLAFDRAPLPYNVKTVWHNSFDDLLGGHSAEVFSGVSAGIKAAAEGGAMPVGLEISQPSAMVLASVPQGRQLRADIERLKWPVNSGFEGLVMASATERTIIRRKDGLDLTVLSPGKDRLAALYQGLYQRSCHQPQSRPRGQFTNCVNHARISRF